MQKAVKFKKQYPGKCIICGKKYSYKIVGIFGNDQQIRVPIRTCRCLAIEEARKKKEEHILKVKEYYDRSRIDKYFLDQDFRVVNRDLLPFYNDISWIKRGQQLLIYGDPGNWKTGQITVICKKAMDNLISVRYCRATQIPNMYFNDQKEYRSLERARLLIIDNFGKEKSERSAGSIFDLIDYRIHNYRATVLITNGSIEDVVEVYSAPLLSRLNMFNKIEIDGEDKRKLFQGIKNAD